MLSKSLFVARPEQALAIQPGRLSRRVSEMAPAVPFNQFTWVGLSDPSREPIGEARQPLLQPLKVSVRDPRLGL